MENTTKYIAKKMCTRKRRHTSRFKAEAKLREDLKKGLYEAEDKHVYQCPLCGYWHIGG